MSAISEAALSDRFIVVQVQPQVCAALVRL